MFWLLDQEPHFYQVCGKAHLVDAIGLNGRVDEFRDELFAEILQRGLRCMLQSETTRPTLMKNFLAPTFKALALAASKSCRESHES